MQFPGSKLQYSLLRQFATFQAFFAEKKGSAYPGGYVDPKEVMKPKEKRMKQNIVCYMLISNNKQLKYREGKTAWECGILPRDNLSHL
jgi:hypothetical protein